MGSISIWHWLIVLVIVVLVFGTKKLTGMGKDLGAAVRGFKEGMQGDEAANAAKQAAASADAHNDTTKVIDSAPHDKR